MIFGYILAFIYLMEVKEDIEIYTVCDLEISYLKKLLESVVIGISAMQECGIIETNSFLVTTEELTCELVFDIIKNIEFK